MPWLRTEATHLFKMVPFGAVRNGAAEAGPRIKIKLTSPLPELNTRLMILLHVK